VFLHLLVFKRFCEDDDIIIAVYEYWLNKRLRTRENNDTRHQAGWLLKNRSTRAPPLELCYRPSTQTFEFNTISSIQRWLWFQLATTLSHIGTLRQHFHSWHRGYLQQRKKTIPIFFLNKQNYTGYSYTNSIWQGSSTWSHSAPEVMAISAFLAVSHTKHC